MKRVRFALRSPLFGTIVGAVLLVLAISVWLLADDKTSRADAVRTGGLAGGALVALYALWLNDRRRRVEEGRERIERERHELERGRVSDELFARSIELLGHDADQVRVGALHALAGLARSRPEYTQTTLDVVCSYLRRPFSYPGAGDDFAREQQVRLTAQRILVDLLPATDADPDADAPAYDLDLTGAAVEYLDLSGRRIGTLLMRQAALHASTNLGGCELTGPAWFTGATTHGPFRCHHATFHDRAGFSGTTFTGPADFTGTTFGGELSLTEARLDGDALFRDVTFGAGLDLRHASFDRLELSWLEEPTGLSLYNTLVNAAREHRLPASWLTEELPDGRTRLTVPNV